MKVDGERNWIMINHTANSLLDVIADGAPKQSTAGKDTWRSLMNSSLLEPNCNRKGFNLQPAKAYGSYVKVRIGLVANNQDDCNSCHSCIGFGISVSSCQGTYRDSASCGTSKAGCHGKRNQNMAAFGYILVQ